MGGPVADGRKILSEGSRFEVFDRMICRVVGKLLAEGQISRRGAAFLVESLMYRNSVRIFGLEEMLAQ
jgi:glucuronate isomerase